MMAMMVVMMVTMMMMVMMMAVVLMIVMITVHLVRKKGLERVRFRMRASPHQIEIRVGMAYLEMMIEWLTWEFNQESLTPKVAIGYINILATPSSSSRPRVVSPLSI